MDRTHRAGAQIALLFSQMSTAHISMEEHQIEGENVVHIGGHLRTVRHETYEEKGTS